MAIATMLLLANYCQAQIFSAKEKGKKYGYINERGEYLIAPKFDWAGPFSKGFAIVKVGKKFGVINSKGDFTVQPQYERAQPYAPDAKITVMKGGKWGVIDAQGKIIIPFEHEYLSVFKDSLIVGGNLVTEKGYKGRVSPMVLNQKNQLQIKVGVDSLDFLSEYSSYQVTLPGIVDKKTGNYQYAWPMVREGWLVLKEALEGGYDEFPGGTNIKMVNVIGRREENLTPGQTLSDDYFGYREGAMALDWRLLEEDLDGTGVSVGIYIDTLLLYQGAAINSRDSVSKVHPFFNGVAAIERNNRWVFIDREGWTISSTNLSTSEYRAYPPMFFNGLVGFFKNHKGGFVNVQGKTIIPFEYDEIHPFEYDVTTVKKNGLYGLLRKDGTWAVPPKFEDLMVSPCPCYQ